jgi:O-succinylbenzoate synthase
MSYRFQHHVLRFHKPAKTSRDTLLERDVYYLRVQSPDGAHVGWGECAPIWGLSPESKPELESVISRFPQLMQDPEALQAYLDRMPSLKFAVETALLDVVNGGERHPFQVDLMQPIVLNGLVWMGDIPTMLASCREKVEQRFYTVKFKIGAHALEDELEMIRAVRSEFSESALDIRLDANGAYSAEEALEVLDRFSKYRIHSIEQPIKQGQWEAMARLCEKSPIPIALDEELIGVNDLVQKRQLLDTIRPQYIVLKPTLHGGFYGCDEWITLAQERKIQWWVTSALESNIGLNAIAHWFLTKKNDLPQGLGTGSLYANNIQSPWVVHKGMLLWDEEGTWNLQPLER